jgi:hypothetical protein
MLSNETGHSPVSPYSFDLSPVGIRPVDRKLTPNCATPEEVYRYLKAYIVQARKKPVTLLFTRNCLYMQVKLLSFWQACEPALPAPQLKKLMAKRLKTLVSMESAACQR